MIELQALKPVLTALVLPPVPWLLLILFGSWLSAGRRRLGMALVALGVALVWLSACQGTGRWLQAGLLQVPAPLGPNEVAALKPAATQPSPTTVILVLGGGRIPRAPESGTAELKPLALERLRYGVRLARESGLPLAVSGGVGWAQRDDAGLSEAETARLVAERDFLRPVKWIETASRDTRENAVLSVRQLNAAGIKHIVLVTHAWHMPRALRAFRQAAGDSMRVTAAPMGYFAAGDRTVFDWLPGIDGFEQVRLVLREALALRVGA